MLYKNEEEKELFKMVQWYTTYKHDIRQWWKKYRKLGYENNTIKPNWKNYIEIAKKEKAMERK